VSPAISAIWSLFLAGIVSLTIVVAALVTAMVVAQRRRLAMQQDYSQRVLQAHEEERAWVARELHDDLLQRVAMIRHEMDDLWSTQGAAADSKEAQRMRALTGELNDLGVALRNVAHRLHPTIVDQIGLPRALDSLAQEVGRAGLAVSIDAGSAPPKIPSPVAHAAYRIAQEALRNVAKHAGTGAADLSLSAANSTLLLRVIDRGAGFEPGADGRGLGLASMSERAALVKGTLQVTSRRGEGTTVEARLPLGAT